MLLAGIQIYIGDLQPLASTAGTSAGQRSAVSAGRSAGSLLAASVPAWLGRASWALGVGGIGDEFTCGKTKKSVMEGSFVALNDTTNHTASCVQTPCVKGRVPSVVVTLTRNASTRKWKTVGFAPTIVDEQTPRETGVPRVEESVSRSARQRRKRRLSHPPSGGGGPSTAPVSTAAPTTAPRPKKRRRLVKFSGTPTVLGHAASMDRECTPPDIFSCDGCGRTLTAGLRGFEVYASCSGCGDFDLCFSCCDNSDAATARTECPKALLSAGVTAPRPFGVAGNGLPIILGRENPEHGKLRT